MAHSIRTTEYNLQRIKANKTDWFFNAGVYGGLYIIVILLVALFCVIFGINF